MNLQSQTIRVLLVDGTATGILTAEIMNWTGHILVAPRSKLHEALAREEAKRTGVYLLVGQDPETPSMSRLYVGEGDVVVDRLKMHAKDPSKEFWTKAYIITSNDTNLTKSHVRYLESRIVQVAKAVGRAVVMNGNEPSAKNLPESDVAYMEAFLHNLQIVLPLVGADVLRPTPLLERDQVSPNAFGQSDSDTLELIIESKKLGILARAVEGDGEITVLSGSTATAKDFAKNSYSDLRSSLLTNGSIIPSAKEDVLVFVRDVTFASPSAAAAVIFNRNSNGRAVWKLKSTGETLKVWQDSKLDDLSNTIRYEEIRSTENLPEAGAEFEDYIQFCLSLDPSYGQDRSIDECFDIAKNVERVGLDAASADDLKTSAYIWQRAYVWGSPDEAPMFERKIRAAIDELRSRKA